MSKYHNKKDTKRIGERIKSLRQKRGWNIEDIASMTGFSRSTLFSIENGSNTDTSHLIEIAKAIGIHPKDIFDISFDLKPRYKLPRKRADRKQLTHKINQLVSESSFFEEPRFVADVKDALFDNYKIKTDPIQISVILIRLVESGKLISRSKGKKNEYLLPRIKGRIS